MVIKERIQIIVETIMKGAQNIPDIAQDLGKVGIVTNATGKAIAASTGKLADTKNVIDALKKKYDSFSGVMGLSMDTWKKLNSSGFKFETIGGRVANRFRMLTHGMRGFKMEMLSVMFFGMGLSAMFTGMLKPAMDAYGIFDLWNTMLLLVFLPIIELIFPVLLGLMTWFMDFPEGVKIAIGAIAILGVIFGTILFVVGTLTLGFGGLAAAWAFFLTLISPALAVFAVVAGAFLIIVGIIEIFKGKLQGIGLIITGIGVILLLFIGWWALIPIAVGLVIYFLISKWTAVKEFFFNILNSIRDFFIKIFGVDIIGYIMDLASKFINFGKNVVNWIVDGIKSIGSRIWDAILSGFGKAKDFVSNIFGGGGTKTYGDMIWRPGSAPIAVSPNDTITASKSGAGGTNISPTINISVNANVNSDYDVRKLASELSRYMTTEFERISKGRGII